MAIAEEAVGQSGKGQTTGDAMLLVLVHTYRTRTTAGAGALLGGKGEPLGTYGGMVVSGAAPDWALVRELASIFCCRMAWTTQIGQALGPFRGGHGLAGGCDCDRMGLSRCQCNALPTHRASDHWRPGGDQTTARAQTHHDAPRRTRRAPSPSLPGLVPSLLASCRASRVTCTHSLAPTLPVRLHAMYVCMDACVCLCSGGKREGEGQMSESVMEERECGPTQRPPSLVC